MAFPVWADFVVPNSKVETVGEVRLVPQWETLRTPLPYSPKWASVIGEFREGRKNRKRNE